MQKKLKVLLTALLLPILFGCSSSPPRKYVKSETTPSANLRSSIEGAYSRKELIEIYVAEGTCKTPLQGRIFEIKKSKTDPAGFVKIAANQPLRLHYFEEGAGGYTCDISLEVNLEEGKSYSLIGGFDYKSGPIPILTGTRMCRFGVQDDETKMLVPIKKCS